MTYLSPYPAGVTPADIDAQYDDSIDSEDSEEHPDRWELEDDGDDTCLFV